jgi:hypothetical protein
MLPNAVRAPLAALAVLGITTLMCISLIPHDVVGPVSLVNQIPVEAFKARDYRNGEALPLGSRVTDEALEELEDRVTGQVDDMEKQVAGLKDSIGSGTIVSVRMGVEVRTVPSCAPRRLDSSLFVHQLHTAARSVIALSFAIVLPRTWFHIGNQGENATGSDL